MATKPASGSSLDTGSSLFSVLSNVWGFLEGTGTTSADPAGGKTATFQGSEAWGSDAEGAYLSQTVDGSYVSFSNVTIPIHTSFSIAFGCSISVTGNPTMITGDKSSTGRYWWMHGANSAFTANNDLFSGSFIIAGSNSQANHNNYLLSFAYSGGNYTLNLYNNGTLQTSSPYTVVAGSGVGGILNAIGAGYATAGFSLIGKIYYFYLMQGYAATQTDATNLNANPYFIYSVPVSFASTPSTIPAGHAGNITLTLAGTNTTWTTGSTVTIQNSVTGTTTVTAGTWTRTSNTAATLVVTTGAGAGTFTITIDGHVSPTLTVAAATMSVFGRMGGTSLTEPITLTGVNTRWDVDTPTFTISAGTGNSIGTFVYTDATHATAVVTCGSANGAYTITDPSTGATCTFTIATPHSYNFISSLPSWVQIEGYPLLAGSPQYYGGRSDGCIRFRAKCGQIDVKNAASGGFFRVAIDGVFQGSGPNRVIPTNAAVRTWMPVVDGLDPTTEHEYIVWFGGVVGAVAMYISDLLLIDGTGPNTAALTARSIVMEIGDSVSIGAQLPNFDSSLSYLADLGAIGPFQISNKAIGSRAISSGGGAGTGVVGNLSDYSGFSPAPVAVYFLDGVVDVLDTYDVTQFGTDYATCIASFAAAYPTALIICCKIQPHDPTSTLVDPYNVKIAAAVTAAANPKIIYSTVIYDLVKASGLVGYHPNTAAVAATWAVAIQAELNGLFPSVGSAAITLGNDTVAGVGGQLATGLAAITLANDSVAGSGSFTVAASATITLADDTVAGLASPGCFAAANIILNNDIVTSGGGFAVNATAAITLANDTILAAAEGGSNVFGPVLIDSGMASVITT